MRNRKLKVLALMVLVCGCVWGQENNFPPNGNSTIYQSAGSYRAYDVVNADGLITSRFETTTDKTGQIWFKDASGNTRVLLRSNSSPSYIMGYLGIGTTTPGARLTTIQNGTIGGKNLQNAGLLVGSTSYGIGIDDNEIVKKGDGGFNLHATTTPIYFRTGEETSYARMTILQNGNVGIGTTDPQSRLSIEGNINGWMQTIKGSVTNKDQFIGIKFNTGYMDEYNKWCGIAAIGENLHSNISSLGFYANQTEKMRLLGTGELGIGTLNPQAKLDVAGNIKAQEIEVTLASIDDMQLNGTLAANNITLTTNGQTADFVFSDSYQLTPLSEVESFIKTNKHLPEIPSAAQMEEQGVNLAEMNKLLLQKVEELTLYVIDLKKENKTIKGERNREQGARLKETENRKKLEKEMSVMKEELQAIKEMITIKMDKK